MGDVKAVIFDMDGVISDTQKLHSLEDSRVLASVGIKISPKKIDKEYAGIRNLEIYEKLLKKYGINANPEKMLREKRKRMMDHAKINVREIKGSVNLIKWLYDNGYKLAVASSSRKTYVNRIIKTLKVKKYFKVVISGDMVKKGKPNPECFLTASKILGFKPSNCVVIEDSINGMNAAKRAKMKCIGIVKDKRGSYPTRNLIRSLNEIDKKFLDSLK